MAQTFKIAIDGPGGAGKSTIAKLIAKKLGIDYIDTGAMYRALGLKMMNLGLELQDEEALKEVLAKTEIDFKDGDIILDGQVVSQLIRTPEVSMAASKVSAFSFVRKHMVAAQQKMGESKSVIMDGRDICTDVFPDAEYKYFVTADAKERAMRRYKELLEKGQEAVFEQVLADIEQRDYNDSTRAVSPLKQAPDAELVDTTHMTIEEVVNYICDKVKA
ncbi:MAG: (d)CMP kinase [Firmicutes bacterium]|nr:(d)CMP kinase [Bacillota bacterium]